MTKYIWGCSKTANNKEIWNSTSKKIHIYVQEGRHESVVVTTKKQINVPKPKLNESVGVYYSKVYLLWFIESYPKGLRKGT